MYAHSGTYQVQLISSNACGIDTIIKSVNVVCEPIANFNYSVSYLSVSFSDSSLNSSSRVWDFGDGSSDTSLNPSHTYTQSGTYQVCLISNNSCSSDTICQSFTVLVNNISSYQFNKLVKVYPSPTTGQITVDLVNTYKEVDITIRNVIGQIVLSKNLKSTNQLSFELNGPSGIYFIEIRTTEKSAVFKVVKK